MRYEPAPLRLSIATPGKTLGRRERSSNADERCCWAAGNCSLISNAASASLLSNNGSKSTDSSVEYERILFETHGCSVYHHYRLQLLDDDCIEAEF